ncbi:MAG: glutaredoxin family protein [Minisyncoccia bacterium]
MTTAPVTIYSTPTCHFCGMAKEFFKANNILFTEHDVAADIAQRKEMIDKSGQMGVPVITVGDKLVVGFDEEELRSLLGL